MTSRAGDKKRVRSGTGVSPVKNHGRDGHATSDEFPVRQFRESDVVAVRRLIHHTIDVCYSSFYPPCAVEFFRNYHSDAKILERHREGEILVVEHEGQIVGTGAIVRDDISGVFVHPAFQSKGIGRVLMQHLEARAKGSGYDEAVLSVSLPSKAFYESFGYEIIENRSIDVGGGQNLDFWQASKILAEES